MKKPKYIVAESASSPERLRTLADGVFAIVMTLLVLELGVEEIAKTSINKEISQGLLHMWPKFLIYGLSFLILGIFWVIHHAIFDFVRRSDTTLSWLNILFLMFVALIPFSTLLVGKFGAKQITAAIYGVNMFLIFNLGWALWSYATRKRRLTDSDIDLDWAKGGSKMGLVYFIIILLAIGLSFINPIISFFIYGLIVVAFILATVLGRGELVMSLPAPSKPGDENRYQG